jgi:hypothetical protein
VAALREPDEIFPVAIRLSDGRTVDGRFRIWEESPENSAEVMVELTYADRRIVAASAKHFFDALLEIRRQSDAEGVLIECYGCSRTVYPSAMALDMGYGERAYKLHLGEKARSADLVSIFDTGADVDSTTIDVQRAYYEEWLESFS